MFVEGGLYERCVRGGEKSGGNLQSEEKKISSQPHGESLKFVHH